MLLEYLEFIDELVRAQGAFRGPDSAQMQHRYEVPLIISERRFGAILRRLCLQVLYQLLAQNVLLKHVFEQLSALPFEHPEKPEISRIETPVFTGHEAQLGQSCLEIQVK